MNNFRPANVCAAYCVLALALSLTGCEHLSRAMTVKNPVVPPAPVRSANPLLPSQQETGLAYVDDPVFSTPADDQGPIRTASASSEEPVLPPQRLPSGEVAALVNGVPIFVDDVLEPFNADLYRAARDLERMPPSQVRQIKQQQLRQARQQLVKQYIKPHIERQLLIQALKSRLKDEQLTALDKFLDQGFDEEIIKMMKVFGVSTLAELDHELAKNGDSVDSQRTKFKNQRMAQQFYGLKVSKIALDRTDLLAYYHEHIQDYEYPGQVRWQQIVLRNADHGGRSATRKLADRIIDELRHGTEFDALARKYSSGSTAAKGGHFDWTRIGSFADSDVEKTLFSLSDGQFSLPLERDDGLQIVRLVEKKEAGRKSFASVQGEIKDLLRESEFRQTAEAALKELYDNASIELKYETAPDGPLQHAS